MTELRELKKLRIKKIAVTFALNDGEEIEFNAFPNGVIELGAIINLSDNGIDIAQISRVEEGILIKDSY